MSLTKTDPQHDNWVKMLTYGPVGTGKTTFAGTAADCEEAQDVLFISPDKGEDTIQDKDFDVVRIDDFEQMDEVKEYVHAHTYNREQGNDDKLKEIEEHFFGEVPDELPHYNTIVLDSLTELNSYLVYDVVGDDISDSISELGMIEIQHYNEIQRKLKALVRDLRDFDANIIVTATEQLEKDDRTGEVTVIPKLTSDYGADVAELVNIVGYTTTEEQKNGDVNYKMKFEAGSKYKCKQRYGLPAEMEDPTFTEIYEYVQ